jgi:phosphatidylserine decarboxylase
MLPLSRHGIREMVVGSIVLALLAWGLSVIMHKLGLGPTLAYFLPLVLILPVWVWLFAFFRDPERPVPTDANIMVSPADGTVSDITDIENSELVGGPAVRVGIFLSVFSVHVNRAPCDGTVTHVIYKKGKFINAMSHHKASDENEANTIVLADPLTNAPVAAVKQIVGLIARRIICTSRVGDTVKRGDRIGLIKFGSRTELIIPKSLEPEIAVSVGQKVTGAAHIIATLKKPVHAATAAPSPTPASPVPA